MSDVFKMSKILKKMDLKLETEGKTQAEVGTQLVVHVMSNLHMAENEINEFVGSLVNLSAEDFAQLPITESLKYFEEFKSLPGIGSFLKSAVKSMK